MARIILQMAMDFKEMKGAGFKNFSYRVGGQWYFVEEGPKFRNVFKVIEYGPGELETLIRLEVEPEQKPTTENKTDADSDKTAG